MGWIFSIFLVFLGFVMGFFGHIAWTVFMRDLDNAIEFRKHMKDKEAKK